MNFEFNFKPHFEFLLTVVLSFVHFMTLGIVKLEPKGIEEFNNNSVQMGTFVGYVSGLVIYAYIVYNMVASRFC